MPFSQRHSNVERTFVHIKPGTFFILDRIQSDRPRLISQFFQIGPDAKIDNMGVEGLVMTSRLDESALTLQQLGPIDEFLHHYGNENPMRGWRSTDLNVIKPNASVQFDQFAQKAEFHTILHVNETDVVYDLPKKIPRLRLVPVSDLVL